MMKENTFAKLLKNLLFPPKCVACREFIQKDLLDKCEIPLCEKCRTKWEREKLDRCPDCGLEMTVCNCGSRMLDKVGVTDIVKLVNYSVKQKSVGKSAVLYMKKHKSSAAFDYFASQLSFAVGRKIREYGETVITYVPRSEKSVSEYGFDQSKMLADRLAHKCGVECLSLFSRTSVKRVEQKKLKLSERFENAKGLYELDEKAVERLEGVKCVVIVDDVITSGASLSGCVNILKSVFDGEVVCAAVARTGKKRKKG